MKKFKFCPMCAAPLVERVKDRVECSADCGFVNYDNPTPVAAVVVEYEGNIVLAHNRSWPNTFYGLITGFVDHREGPAQCAVREVKEELDLDATPATLIGVYPFERMNQVIIGYHVQATGTITLNEELDSFKLMPPEECVVWPAGTGYALRDWLRSQGVEPEMMTLP
jgi:NADH pyrophosphatase NudC (nudix superfamily)